MTMKENEKVEKIKARYEVSEKVTKLDELKALDEKVKRPALVTAYVVGTLGALTLGAGMSMAMKVLAGGMLLGVGVGVVGLALVSVNYFLYKGILKRRKKKYAKQIVELSNALLNK